MNQDLGLNILSRILAWSDEHARKEFDWLRLMARLKYDGYRDFQAGMRFIESLATWLQQFTKEERETAYAFVRSALVYIGPGEMQRLVEQFYPREVRDRLMRMIAARRGIPLYRLLADAAATDAVTRLGRQTLFMGLSDGARIDIVRHSTVGLLTNEQLVVATQVDTNKWKDLLDKLREDLKDNDARFAMVYLIDDFMGTGTSLLSYNEEKQKWSGKLIRFKKSMEDAADSLQGDHLFEPEWHLCVHHYVGSAHAKNAIQDRAEKAKVILEGSQWTKAIYFSFGTVLPDDLPIDKTAGRYDQFIDLTRKYYDPILRTRHTDVGGVTHIGLGYGGCALPLVLDHNTPNNSVALLWAETDGGARDGEINAPAMRPLFRRRQRHA
jgi:hypothetical protein